MYCLDKNDKFGNPVDMNTYGNWESHFVRYLSLTYRPCIPKQRTEFNKNEGCLINDINNQT